MFHQSMQCLVPAELELVRSTELPPSAPHTHSRIHESREEGKRGHLLVPEQETKQRKKPRSQEEELQKTDFHGYCQQTTKVRAGGRIKAF